MLANMDEFNTNAYAFLEKETQPSSYITWLKDKLNGTQKQKTENLSYQQLLGKFEQSRSQGEIMF